jgi:hypothetical protein
MKSLFAAMLALACVVGSTDGFARGTGFGGAHGFAHSGAGRGHGPTIDFGNPPQQAPVINGPMSQPSLRGM